MVIVGGVVMCLVVFRNEKGKLGGELLLGGTDPAHYIGDLGFVPLSQQTYWQFQVDRYGIMSYVAAPSGVILHPLVFSYTLWCSLTPSGVHLHPLFQC